MLRKLMITTAAIALMSGSAFAQTQPAPAETAPAPTPMAPATPEAAPAAPEATIVKPDGVLATSLIGENVYNGPATDAPKIGDVNDLVIDTEGKVEQLVIGVGGFLGIGEKNVAIEYGRAEWAERNGDRWLVVGMTKEELQSAPEFDRTPYLPAAPAATTDVAPAAPAEAAQAPAEQPAAAGETETTAIDKSTLTPVPEADLTAGNLAGTTVYGPDDKNIGEIGEVVVSAENKTDAVVLDVGGFLGIGEKKVAVAMENLAFLTDKDNNRYLYTTFTKEQLEAATAYDAATFAANRDAQLLKM
jgi:sporulation protein YlmC with PRC-barrel domain